MSTIPDRAREAEKLRKEGLTRSEIGDRMGLSPLAVGAYLDLGRDADHHRLAAVKAFKDWLNVREVAFKSEEQAKQFGHGAAQKIQDWIEAGYE